MSVAPEIELQMAEECDQLVELTSQLVDHKMYTEALEIIVLIKDGYICKRHVPYRVYLGRTIDFMRKEHFHLSKKEMREKMRSMFGAVLRKFGNIMLKHMPKPEARDPASDEIVEFEA